MPKTGEGTRAVQLHRHGMADTDGPMCARIKIGSADMACTMDVQVDARMIGGIYVGDNAEHVHMEPRCLEVTLMLL